MSYTVYADGLKFPSFDKWFATDFAVRLNAKYVDKGEFRLDGFDHDNLMRTLKRCIIVQNNETGSFFLIHHHDLHYRYRVLADVMRLDKCIGVLHCQYRKDKESLNEPKLFPYTYIEKDPLEFQTLIEDVHKIDVLDKLYFRGDIVAHDGRRQRRAVLPLLADVLNPDYDKRVGRDVFCNELGRSKLALGVPGNGNFCHRELECFAIQTPVLMPRLLNSYWNELIPNHHYVSVETDWRGEKPQVVAEKIRQRYFEVKDDTIFLEGVAKNAFQWYNDNVAYPANVNLALKILKLEI